MERESVVVNPRSVSRTARAPGCVQGEAAGSAGAWRKRRQEGRVQHNGHGVTMAGECLSCAAFGVAIGAAPRATQTHLRRIVLASLASVIILAATVRTGYPPLSCRPTRGCRLYGVDRTNSERPLVRDGAPMRGGEPRNTHDCRRRVDLEAPRGTERHANRQVRQESHERGLFFCPEVRSGWLWRHHRGHGRLGRPVGDATGPPGSRLPGCGFMPIAPKVHRGRPRVLRHGLRSS